MQSILDFFHSTVGLPWAWSIVALTILVRILLVPLTVRQIHSMQSLQAHAPEMKEIQRKYKGDRTKLNEELMKFYKENHINPAASACRCWRSSPSSSRSTSRSSTSRQPHHGLVAAHRPEHLGEGDVALVRLPAARDLRRLADRVDLLHGRDDGQDAAADHDVPADHLHHVRRAVPDGPDHLLDDDEPLDSRPGARHPPARPEAERGRERRRRPARSGPRGRRAKDDGTGNGAAIETPRQAATPPAQPRRVKKKKGGARR